MSSITKGWLKSHHTLIGFLAMFVAATQLNSEYILQLIPEHGRPLILFGFGMISATISWVNSVTYEGFAD